MAITRKSGNPRTINAQGSVDVYRVIQRGFGGGEVLKKRASFNR